MGKNYREGNVKGTTLQTGHYCYTRYFFHTIGKMKIKDVKQIDIVTIYKGMKENGLKYATIKNANSLLRAILNAAVDNGIIQANPVNGIVLKDTGEQKEQRVLTEKDEKIFLDFVQKDVRYRNFVPLFIVGFGTGMRIGEMLGLTWNDIDFESEIIHIKKTLSLLTKHADGNKLFFSINTPKTKSSTRDIPMTARVKAALEEQRKNHTPSNVIIDGYSDFVFTTKTGNVFNFRNIGCTLNKIVQRMNKEESERASREKREAQFFEKFHPHSMRHTFATRCYEKGISEKVVQKILGHSKVDITLNRYTHTTDDTVREDIRKLEE